MNFHMRSIQLAGVVALILGGGAALAQEQHNEFAVRGGVGYSDNLGRSASNPIDSAFYSVGSTIDYVLTSARTHADVKADLDWVDYQDSAFSSHLWGRMDGNLQYQLVPGRFAWTFQNNLGQAAKDPYSAVTSNNTENVNYFTTGPDLTFRFGGQMGLELDARYSNVWFQTSPNDNNRYSGGASLVRYLSAASRLFARAEYMSVKYTSGSPATDFDAMNGFIGYASEGARNSLKVDAGYTSVDIGSDRQSGPLFRLSYSRKLSEAFSADLNAGYEFKDAARTLRGMQSGAGSNGDVVSTGDVLKDTYGRAGLRFEKLRTQIRADAEYHHEDYLTNNSLDRDRTRLFVQYRRQLGRPFALTLDARYDIKSYWTNSSLDSDEWSLGSAFAWRVGPAVNLDLQYRYFKRPSSSFGSYDENRLWLNAQWTPGQH
jgi:hypothetical protein